MNKKIIGILICMLFFGASVLPSIGADNTGWKNPSGYGRHNNEWENPQNVYISDDVYAKCCHQGTTGTEWKESFENFNFNIPSEVTILGIEIQVEGYCYTGLIHLYLHVWQDNEWSTPYSNLFDDTEEYQKYGGSTDLWGYDEWEPSDFDNSNFSVKAYPYGGGLDCMHVDHLQVKIYYSINIPPSANFTYTPLNPIKNDIIEFNDTSTAPNSTIVSWWWDFDNGYYSDLKNPVHCYYSEGTYDVSLTVTNNIGISNSTQKTIVVTTNSPPDIPEIWGPSSGTQGQKLWYEFNSTDPEEDAIMYNVDWGDGDTEWTEYGNSGVGVTLTHTYLKSGTYIIKAQAVDIHGAESDWAEFTVVMPRDKVINRPFLNFLENYPSLFPLFQKLLLRFGL